MRSTQNTAPVRASCAAWTGAAPVVRPVCVAAVILDPAAPVDGVNDSKKLSEKKRELLYPQIIEKALAYKVVMVGASDHRRAEYTERSLLGMRQAVEGPCGASGAGAHRWQPVPGDGDSAQSVVKGDARSASISAASILAKVSRDRYMEQLAKEYPQYPGKASRDIRPSCITRCWTNTAFSRFTAGPF